MDKSFTSELYKLKSDLALQGLASMREELKAAFRWLYATAVVLNSGALFLTANSPEVHDQKAHDIALVLFSSGILAAIVLGYRTIMRANKGTGMARSYLIHLIYEQNEKQPPAKIEFDPEALDDLNKGTRYSIWIGWLSFLCFFVGLVFVRLSYS